MTGRPRKQPVAKVAGVDLWLCTCCREPLPSSRFGVDENTSTGLASWCRKCKRESANYRRAVRGRNENE